MHILLTDILTCPRCGPTFGLIVLADRMEDRLVLAGFLGCANCRAQYPVDGGVVDLRRPELAPLDVGEPAVEDSAEDRVFRVAAATGAQPPGSYVLLVSSTGSAATRYADLLAEARIVSVTPAPEHTEGTPEAADQPAVEGGFDRVIAARTLPFRTGAFRAAAVVGPVAGEVLAEVRRVLAPGARIVIDSGSSDSAERLAELGFEVLLDQPGTVVAAAPRPG